MGQVTNAPDLARVLHPCDDGVGQLAFLQELNQV